MAYTHISPSSDPATSPHQAGERVGVVSEKPAQDSDSGRARSAADALLSIRQARDSVLARNLELTSKLAAAEDRIAELEYEREAADRARDSALELAKDLTSTSDELRAQVLALGGENSKLELAKRDAVIALEVARSARTESPSECEIEAARVKAAESEAASSLIRMRLEKSVESLTEQLGTAMRARDIAVDAMSSAQRQIENLSTERNVLRAQVDADNAAFAARLALIEARLPVQESAQPTAPPPAILSVPHRSGDAFSADSAAPVVALKDCVARLTAEPENRLILDELDERFHEYAANAGGAGRPAIARLASGCGELTRWLRKTPRKIPDMLDRLRESIALIAELSADIARDSVADPAGALVYSVDDDVDNCECVSMSLEKMALRTRYAVKPEAAIADLAAGPCDLIILDVDLGSTNGFDLAKRIREFEIHRETPIIFLSGLMSAKARLSSIPGGRTTFVAKPYNLNELGVIALTMILKGRLDSAKSRPAA